MATGKAHIPKYRRVEKYSFDACLHCRQPFSSGAYNAKYCREKECMAAHKALNSHGSGQTRKKKTKEIKPIDKSQFEGPIWAELDRLIAEGPPERSWGPYRNGEQ